MLLQERFDNIITRIEEAVGSGQNDIAEITQSVARKNRKLHFVSLLSFCNVIVSRYWSNKTPSSFLCLIRFFFIGSCLFLHQFVRLHHFFLNFVKISVIVKYNAVGVENIARQIG